MLGDSGDDPRRARADTATQFGTLPITVGLVATTFPTTRRTPTAATTRSHRHAAARSSSAARGRRHQTDRTSTARRARRPTSTNFIFGDDGYITWVGAELNPSSAPAERRASGTAPTPTPTTSTPSSRPIRPTAATTRSRSAPARRSSSAARATTRSPAAPARTSSSATAARSSRPPHDTTQFGTLPITVGLVETTRAGHRRHRPHHDRHRRRDRVRRHAGDVIKTDQSRRDDEHLDRQHELHLRRRRLHHLGRPSSTRAPRRRLNAAGIFTAPTRPGDIDAVVSTDPSDGGNDTITLGAGKAIVVGGSGRRPHHRRHRARTSSSATAADPRRLAGTATQFGDLPITVGLVQTTFPRRDAHYGGVDTSRRHRRRDRLRRHAGDDASRRSEPATGRRAPRPTTRTSSSATTATSRGSAAR